MKNIFISLELCFVLQSPTHVDTDILALTHSYLMIMECIVVHLQFLWYNSVSLCTVSVTNSRVIIIIIHIGYELIISLFCKVGLTIKLPPFPCEGISILAHRCRDHCRNVLFRLGTNASIKVITAMPRLLQGQCLKAFLIKCLCFYLFAPSVIKMRINYILHWLVCTSTLDVKYAHSAKRWWQQRNESSDYQPLMNKSKRQKIYQEHHSNNNTGLHALRTATY